MKLLTSPFGSVGPALAKTLEAARASGDNYIEIPYGEYDIYKEDCAHAILCVSNHGHNGYKSAALVIEDFDGLTVDGNGNALFKLDLNICGNIRCLFGRNAHFKEAFLVVKGLVHGILKVKTLV
mgnify:CR=1 FL=1